MFFARRMPATTVFTMFFASGSKHHGIYNVLVPVPLPKASYNFSRFLPGPEPPKTYKHQQSEGFWDRRQRRAVAPPHTAGHRRIKELCPLPPTPGGSGLCETQCIAALKHRGSEGWMAPAACSGPCSTSFFKSQEISSKLLTQAPKTDPFATLKHHGSEGRMARRPAAGRA